ncbi:hypothetical protein ETD86_08920 [Nonomuraea turkmeniaca]|uniref:Uncharacterized protein n=1 Tax=Nonomuraea turkmeniaca TaxID=103838 RepID=A0A5S4FRE2_9ACTN|nr:hypothetical protein ETD86_08920 [Nonomuraea turkmeniaca]
MNRRPAAQEASWTVQSRTAYNARPPRMMARVTTSAATTHLACITTSSRPHGTRGRRAPG